MYIMRKSHLFLLGLLLAVSSTAFSQSSGIEEALKKGDAKALGINFSSSVDLSIPGEEGTFTADKAVTTLSSFFSERVVKGYKKVHASAPQQGRSNFTIGELSTNNGTYRLTMFFNKDQKITELEIRK